MVSLAFSLFAFATTYSLIRWLGPSFIKVGLKGKDMAKAKKPEMYVYSSPLSLVSFVDL